MSIHVYRGLESAPADFGPCALTIGNFDGVHAAHRSIMKRVAELARQNGWRAAVLTFDPHPTTLVAPERAPRLMTTLPQRCPLMESAGIDEVLILPFTWEIARLTPEEFVRDILAARLKARVVLIGENFRFGAKASGNTDTLAALGKQYGFQTEVLPAVRRRNRTVSSSEIRRLIGAGNVYLAGRMLERPYCLDGKVVSGHGVGSKQTVPTLNLETDAGILPGNGVYITRTTDLDNARRWRSVTNIGVRPTFGGDSLTIETFLLDPLEDPSPARIRVEFLHRIRDERKFENPAALKARILRDVAHARAWFRRTDILVDSTGQSSRTNRKEEE
ncbi:MAG TPA: bifunctional riboflavin kinase/FAD synthetase [Bryobacteraceae bacterium]|jgi:riboflavin kinase/FMN adenylyltransferase|nr:bifunctional riboflavin kinase/FAD synthetase [Bryobacteraceae bacterium]